MIRLLTIVLLLSGTVQAQTGILGIVTSGSVVVDPGPPIVWSGKSVRFYGNSITMGYGLSAPATEKWTTKLKTLLGFATEVNYGISGQIMEQKACAWTFGTRPMFDDGTIPFKGSSDGALFIALGVNDADNSGCALTVVAFTTRYKAVIDNAIVKGWTPSQMVLLTPFYMLDSYEADTVRKEAYAQAVRDIALEKHCVLIDVYAWQKADPNSTTYLYDGIHPNAAGHTAIANWIAAQSFTPQ